MVDTPILRFKKLFEQKKRSIKIYTSSIIDKDGSVFFLIREGQVRKLIILSPGKPDDFCLSFVAEEIGELEIGKDRYSYRICPCEHRNTNVLREGFPFTSPKIMGLTPAIGTGDRIGLATPAHIRAAKSLKVFPVLAQQSTREMTRTSRSPEEVLDDVSWSVFQEGYQGGFAADADHLKTEGEIEATFKAGFTMYTIDPSDYVDDEADECDLELLRKKFAKLPWDRLECDAEDFLERYLNKEFKLAIPGEDCVLKLEFSEEKLIRAAVKYSVAIAHTASMSRYLRRLYLEGDFDLEMSVDETDTPTSPLEHFFIASELRRLGVRIQGLALRFVGEFEKAVDYIGDLEEFKEAFLDHLIVAKVLGPYKLSIHSGSDKFSIYPIIGDLASDLLHLKTAGTSYLEALRVVARHDSSLFRRIIEYSLGCFDREKRTYRIGTELSEIPNPEEIRDQDLEKAFLDEDQGRQLLHVTFGSVLTAKKKDGTWLFRDRTKRILIDNEEEHYQTVVAHLRRHIKLLGFGAKTRDKINNLHERPTDRSFQL